MIMARMGASKARRAARGATRFCGSDPGVWSRPALPWHEAATRALLSACQCRTEHWPRAAMGRMRHSLQHPRGT